MTLHWIPAVLKWLWSGIVAWTSLASRLMKIESRIETVYGEVYEVRADLKAAVEEARRDREAIRRKMDRDHSAQRREMTDWARTLVNRGPSGGADASVADPFE